MRAGSRRDKTRAIKWTSIRLPQPRVLSIKEAARACGISRATLDASPINDRKLATVKIASRPYLVECAFGLRQSGLHGNPGPIEAAKCIRRGRDGKRSNAVASLRSLIRR